MFTTRKATTSLLAIAIVTLLAAAPVYGQAPAPTAHPYGFDPYAPSDAMWLRSFGAAIVAHTPLVDLATLDPYKPSDAALVRQLGGAMPLCCLDWYGPGLTFGPLLPLFPHAPGTRPGVRFRPLGDRDFRTADSTQADVPASSAAVPPTASTPSAMATIARPQANDGISIRYEGQTWITAGRAAPLAGSAFERVGQLGGSAVYKQARVNDNIIYVQTRDNLVAPFRVKP
jgi:hypothetical protein